MAEKAYVCLSTVYEKLQKGDLYDRWGERVIKALKENALGKDGIDLACGSGHFTILEKKAGFNVIGVDNCLEMLQIAKQNAQNENLKIDFLRQDMTCLKTFQKVDFVTIINDGVNYVDKLGLKKAFKSVYSALKKGGVFLFDFSTRYKLEKIIGNNLFGEDYEELSYLWFNKLKEDKIEMEISLFLKKGDLYEKKEEEHVQYIHDLDFIEKSLLEVGFKSVSACAHFGGEIDKTTDRIEILAVK